MQNYEKQLNHIATIIDKQGKSISKYTRQLVYQVINEYEFYADDDSEVMEEWRGELISEINNILEIINPKCTSDIYYLEKIKQILMGKCNCEIKKLANTAKFNLN